MAALAVGGTETAGSDGPRKGARLQVPTGRCCSARAAAPGGHRPCPAAFGPDHFPLGHLLLLGPGTEPSGFQVEGEPPWWGRGRLGLAPVGFACDRPGGQSPEVKLVTCQVWGWCLRDRVFRKQTLPASASASQQADSHWGPRGQPPALPRPPPMDRSSARRSAALLSPPEITQPSQ